MSLDHAVYLKNVNRMNQTQSSLHDQLMVLQDVANKLGMYDASDYLRNVNEQTQRKILGNV